MKAQPAETDTTHTLLEVENRGQNACYVSIVAVQATPVIVLCVL
jgi:hypothetical protein